MGGMIFVNGGINASVNQFECVVCSDICALSMKVSVFVLEDIATCM